MFHMVLVSFASAVGGATVIVATVFLGLKIFVPRVFQETSPTGTVKNLEKELAALKGLLSKTGYTATWEIYPYSVGQSQRPATSAADALNPGGRPHILGTYEDEPEPENEIEQVEQIISRRQKATAARTQ